MLVLVEATDVVFAVDSVPAVLAVSHEQFIVFSSNAFAILGLRALYFLLADLHGRFSYLQQGLAVILAFVGVKMIIAEWYHIRDVGLAGRDRRRAGCRSCLAAWRVSDLAVDRRARPRALGVPAEAAERRRRPDMQARSVEAFADHRQDEP